MRAAWVAPALLALALVVSGAPPSASAGQQLSVNLPCGKPGLRSCDEMLNGSKGQSAGTGSGLGAIGATGVLDQLKQRVTEQFYGNPSKGTKGYYQNVDPNPIAPGSAPQPYFGPSVCNLVGGTDFTSSPELTNKNQAPNGAQIPDMTCGSFVDLSCHLSVCTVKGCACSSPSMTVTVSMQTPKGDREFGWLRGGLLAATSCYYMQVVSELKTKHSITVKDFGSVPDPCFQLAADANKASEQVDGMVKDIQGQLTGQQNIADIVNCTRKDETGTGTKGADDQGERRQSAQVLCAARQMLETAVTELASCEIFARAQQSYINQIGTKDAMKSIFDMLNKKVGDDVSNQCYNDLNAGTCNIPSDGDITKCANQRYREKIGPAVQDYVQKLWPAAPSPTQDCADPAATYPGASGETAAPTPTVSPIPTSMNQQPASKRSSPLALGFMPLLFAGSLSPARRRGGGRRRRSGHGKGVQAALIAALNALALAVAVYFGAGCGSSSDTVPQPPYSKQCPGNQSSSCCDSNGNPITPTPSGCTQPAPGGGGLAGSLANGAQAIGAFNSTLPTATKLVGPKGGNVDVGGGPGPFSDAATAGDVASGPGGGKKDQNAANNGGGGGPDLPGRNKRSPGGGDAYGAGGTSKFGSLKTGAFPEPGADGAAATAGGTDGSTFKSGGAGGAGEGDSGGLHHGGSSISGVTSGEQSFGSEGGEAAGATAATMGSEDPADYFTRTGLDESIFKVVERRYKQKQLTWADADAKAPLKAPPTTTQTQKRP